MRVAEINGVLFAALFVDGVPHGVPFPGQTEKVAPLFRMKVVEVMVSTRAGIVGRLSAQLGSAARLGSVL
jgi:hypothetical protein